MQESSDRHFPANCLQCGRAFDTHTCAGTLETETPGDGDVYICLYCGSMNIGTGKAETPFRKPTLQERADIERDPEYKKAQAVRAQAILSYLTQ